MNPIEEKLVAEIERRGPLPFVEVMKTALYDPEHGYYNTAGEKIGIRGDYYTASLVHPAFGATLAEAFARLWSEMETPSYEDDRLHLVEVGGGTGKLMLDVLTALRCEHPSIFEKVDAFMIETSPAMRERQKGALGEFDERVRWTDSLEEMGKLRGVVIFSNELVDAMPVHKLRITSDGLRELYVGLAAAGRVDPPFEPIWGDPTTPALKDYIERLGGAPEGWELEVSLEAVEFLRLAAAVAEVGSLVTIDYGDLVEYLWSPDRRAGTLRSFHRHEMRGRTLGRPGERDITSSVNFTALVEYGKDFGWEKVSYERQAAFLLRHGLLDRVARMAEDTAGLPDLELYRAKTLFVSGGVGENFRVLVQRKGVVTND